MSTTDLTPETIKPFDAEVVARPHRPIYRMHRYFARRPYNLFSALVEHYTQPGDLIVDPFLGGGVTLVEATQRGRRAIGFDTSPLATFVSKTEMLTLDVEAFQDAVARVTRGAAAAVGNIYSTECTSCASAAQVDWFEHALVVRCNGCASEFTIDQAEKLGPGAWACPTCAMRIKAAPSADSETRLVQLHISCDCGSRLQRASLNDLELQRTLDTSRAEVLNENRDVIPDDTVPDNNMQRESALHKKGIYRFHQFFTTRQLIGVAALRREIDKEPVALQPHLLLAFSSTLRFANRMVTRNPSWRGERPLEWVGTGFWLPTVYLDANVVQEFPRRAAAVVKGKLDFNGPGEMVEGAPWRVAGDEAGWSIQTRSSTSMPLPDSSVDAVITDPPYGSYVHYADMSNFWNVWLPAHIVEGAGTVIDASEEAVVARKQFPGAKNTNDYVRLLEAVFAESYRILKPGRAMVLTFNNREPRAWSALLVAALRAGFTVPEGGVHFQPGVANYRQTARTRRAGSVHGDFVFTFQKSFELMGTAPRGDLLDPLHPDEVQRRLVSLVSENSLSTEELMREFYASLIPDLLRYLAGRGDDKETAIRHLETADSLDIFNSERKAKLAAVIDFEDGQWRARKAS